MGNCKQNQGSIYRMCLRWTLMCDCETRARERERERKYKKNCSDTPYNSSLFAKFWRSPITLGFGGFCLVSFCFSQGCIVLSIHVAHQDIHVPMPEKLQAQHAKCNSSSSKQLSSSNYLPKYCELVVANHTHPYGGWYSLRSGGATPYSFYVIGRRSWKAR